MSQLVAVVKEICEQNKASDGDSKREDRKFWVKRMAGVK